MGMFKNREPRRYRPVNIYTDERKERLQKLVDEVRIQQGEGKTDIQADGAANSMAASQASTASGESSSTTRPTCSDTKSVAAGSVGPYGLCCSLS